MTKEKTPPVEELFTNVYPLDGMTCFNCELDCDAGVIYVFPARTKEVPLSW